MKIYDSESGYFMLDEIYEKNKAFNIILGGRGTGKTFNVIDYLIANKIPFLFLRRSLSQLELITATPEMSPIEPVAEFRNFDFKLIKINKYLFKVVDENNNFLAYFSALSTFANLRGFDMSNIKVIVFDEFIPEKGEKSNKNENLIFFNAYETINRNRELKGEPALKVLLLSNANTLNSRILEDLGVLNDIYTMQTKNKEYLLKNDSLLIVNMRYSPVSANKKKTSLYKIQNNDEFNNMSLSNNFSFNDDNIKSFKINNNFEFLTSIDNMAVYLKNNDFLYICNFKKTPEFSSCNDVDIVNFKNRYGIIFKYILKHKIFFSNLENQQKFMRLFNF